MDDQSFLLLSDHQLARHHGQNYTDQLKNVKLKNSSNQYITYKIDYRSFTLPSFSSRKQCLLSIFYVCLLVGSSLLSTISASQSVPATASNGPNSAQAQHSQSPRTVATKYGILRGTIITLPNVNLQQVEAFLGIPYANPPTGKLRLMPPVTSAHFSGIKDADQFGPACPAQPMPQSSFRHSESTNLTSEDCLYLNIYTPISVHQHNIRLPVMVFIHGGDFERGAGSDYDGSILASYGNVIVVTLNYRLGLLGFLSEGTTRGNYGLMDQVAALHWLQENIAEFGGLSNNVTVFGSGSGAACIQLLLLSPMARGLFQRVILQSGSALSPVYPASTLNTLRNAKQIAAQLQCFSSSSSSSSSSTKNNQQHSSSSSQFKDKDAYKDTYKDSYKDAYKDGYKDKQRSKSSKEHKSSELLECLRRQKLEKLMDLQVKQPQFLFKYSPTMEGILFPIDPLKMMSDKQSTFLQYDLMVGVNRAPLSEYFDSHSTPNDPLLTDVNSNKMSSPAAGPMTEEKRDKIIRTLVRNLYTYHLQEIYMTLSNEYRSRTNTSEEEELRLVELINDALLISPLITTALLHSKSQTKSTFVYNYAALDPQELSDYGKLASSSTAKSKDKDNVNITTINEELGMIFGQPLVPSMKLIQRSSKRNYSNLEVKLSEKLMNYWSHFAKTGDPNVQQSPGSSSSSVHHHQTVNSLSNSLSNVNNNLNSNLKDTISNSNHHLSSNYSTNDLITAMQQKSPQQLQLKSEHWPTFKEYTQLYLNLNLHSTISDHMRSHQLSFFLNLLPKLNRPIANNMQMNEHHLLEDHHNLATYIGVVREHPAAGLNRNIALDLEDQLASKRMLELLLNGERQLTEQSNGDEKNKLGSLMKLREKLLKWKFISEQSNMETQQNYDDLIRKLTARIEGGENSGSNLVKRTNSSIIIEMDSNQVELSGQDTQTHHQNNQQQHQTNQLSQENLDQQSNNQDDEQQEESNSIQQNLKQINNPPSGHSPKLNDEQLNYQLHHNANESFSMIIQDGNYSTALSVTIIVGCSLLFLNIIVFAGVFLNRDSRNRRRRRRSEDTGSSPNGGQAAYDSNGHHACNNGDNLLANSGLLVNNGHQLTNTPLSGQQLKAYQANSIYLPCCEYDTATNQQQACNATILTLKRNNSNKTYIAKTSTCGQLTSKHSIEGDYYLQQQQQSNYDEHHHHLTINGTLKANGTTANDCLNNGGNTFDQTLANDARLLDKQHSLDASSGLGSSLDNTSNTLTNNTLNNNKLQMTNVSANDLISNTTSTNAANEHHQMLHHHQQQQQQQQQLNNVDLVNVSCSSAVSSSSATTMITSSPNTLTSTPDYYTANGLHHPVSMLGQFNNLNQNMNQSLNQSNNATAYLNHLHHNFGQSTNDHIQALYGHHQTTNNHYVQLSNFENLNGNYHTDSLNNVLNDTMNALDSVQQQSKLMNGNKHCNVISCSIAQCDCSNDNNIYKDAYLSSNLNSLDKLESNS